MNFSKIPGKIFHNNNFINSEKASIHILNHSLHFSGAVFEGIRVYDGQPFYLDEHIDRLKESCQLMLLDLKYTQSDIREICFKLIEINKIGNGYIRPIAFRDSSSMSPDIGECKSNLSVASWNWTNLYRKNKISLEISKFKKANNTIYPVEAKSTGSYQNACLSKYHALKNGFDDTLFVDIDNFISESSACNIFWVKDNNVFTPKPNSILKGVTRKVVIDILKKNKIKIQEDFFTIDELNYADEVFLTGTAAEIINVSRINNINYKQEEKTNFLKSEFEKLKKKANV